MTLMTANFESIDTLLTGYVGGTLPLPLQVLVDAHLDISDKNKAFVQGLESVAGDALTELPPVDLSDRDSKLSAIFGSELDDQRPIMVPKSQSAMPSLLRDFVGYDIDDIPWRTVMPGFKEFELADVDGFHVSMFWIKPGRTVPAHTHEGSEISLIVQGAFVDERGRFGPGDISIADDTVDHRPTAEKDCPCIGFAVTDAPVRLTGPFHQRLSDILAG